MNCNIHLSRCCVQDQYEKAMSALRQRLEELETKLKGVGMVLQEKVQQLKEQVRDRPHTSGLTVNQSVTRWSLPQLAKNAKSSGLLKDLYVENSELMVALQVTEQRQKKAEKKSFLLEEKVQALNRLLRDVVQVSLAT